MSTTGHTTERTSGWVYFAGTLILALAFLNTLYGITALLNDTWVAFNERAIVAFDLTTLGWTLLILGLIQFAVGLGVLTGATWARILGVTGAFFNLLANVTWMSVYPLWSLTIIVLDVLVIYALIVHGDEVA